MPWDVASPTCPPGCMTWCPGPRRFGVRNHVRAVTADNASAESEAQNDAAHSQRVSHGLLATRLLSRRETGRVVRLLYGRNERWRLHIAPLLRCRRTTNREALTMPPSIIP